MTQASMSTAGNERPRLHNINLSAHDRPFDVLLFTVKDLLDPVRRLRQAANNIVSQDHAIGADRNLFDAAAAVEREQAVFCRPRQNVNRVGVWSKDSLLGVLLSSADLHSQAALGADLTRSF